MKKIKDRILNILYPRRCSVCDGILKNPRRLVCPECQNVLRLVPASRCMRCGRPVAPEKEFCVECENRRRSFSQGRGIFLYDGPMRASMLRYKYHGRREYGEYYAAAMCALAREDILRWRPDVIVPVPLHPAKKRRRGFNQAEYMAERVGRYFHIPVSAGILLKRRKTRSQKRLDAASRRRNLREAFSVEEEVGGLRILLIDDVYTTGSTVEAAAERLMEKGARTVCFLTCCMGISQEIPDEKPKKYFS